MERRTKLTILIAVSILYAAGTLVLAFISYIFNSDGRTFIQNLSDDEGGPAFIQIFLSIGLIVASFLSISFKSWALYALKVLLFLNFAHALLSTLTYHRFKLSHLLYPILWCPIVIFILLSIFTKSYAQPKKGT